LKLSNAKADWRVREGLQTQASRRFAKLEFSTSRHDSRKDGIKQHGPSRLPDTATTALRGFCCSLQAFRFYDIADNAFNQHYPICISGIDNEWQGQNQGNQDSVRCLFVHN
jgi:hypothetical protein